MRNITKILTFILVLIVPGCAVAPRLEAPIGNETAVSRKTVNDLRLMQLESYVNYELFGMEKYMLQQQPGATISVDAKNHMLSADGDVAISTAEATVNGKNVGKVYIISIYKRGQWSVVQMVAHAVNGVGANKHGTEL